MAMPTLKRDWTVEDLLDLPDDGNRYEVLDGELLVTPAPSLDHQRAVFALGRLLNDYLAINRLGEMLISPADVTFSPRRLVQPDVFDPIRRHGPQSLAFCGRGSLAARRRDPLSVHGSRGPREEAPRVSRRGGAGILDRRSGRTHDRAVDAGGRACGGSGRLDQLVAWRSDVAAAHRHRRVLQ